MDVERIIDEFKDWFDLLPLRCEDSLRGGSCISSASLLIGYTRGGSAPR